jgi:hypothetical protein
MKTQWLRTNVVGLVAIVMAFGGTAVLAQAGGDGAQPAAKKKKGKRGPRGPAGAQGPQGPAGPNAVTVVRTQIDFMGPGSGGDYAVCPSGQRATGGGVGFEGMADPDDRVVESGPTNSSGAFDTTDTGSVPDRWFGQVANGAGAHTAYIFAICQ